MKEFIAMCEDNTVYVEVKAKEFGELCAQAKIGEIVNFSAAFEDYEPTGHYGFVIQKGVFDNYYAIIDYWGGGYTATESLSEPIHSKEKDYFEEYDKECIQNFATKYILDFDAEFAGEVYIEKSVYEDLKNRKGE